MSSEKLFVLLFIYFLTLKISRAVLDLNDERFVGTEADRFNWTHHPCHRRCNENEQPKICYYVFVVETYSSMSKACYNCPNDLNDCNRPHCIPADGVQKLLYTVNRQMPGPTIQVCQNDIIVVDVRNKMLSDSTTIHWHGFKQHGTPYMDGVPYVTQCPILPGQTFRYEFNATTDGTFFWHSHIGNQRVDGLFGGLIVHPLFSEKYHKKLYDFDDQMMIVNDWSHLDGDSGEIKQYHYRGDEAPDTILVNGKGRYGDSRKKRPMTKTPLAVFTVRQNKRHRFRMINAGSEYCPIEVTIDDHPMLVISLDSNDIKPTEVDTIFIWPGERVDFIVRANKKQSNYWIRLRGYGLCQSSQNSDGAYQVAILRYDSVNIREPQSRIAWNIPKHTNRTRALNPFQTGTESSPIVNISVPLLNAVAPNDPSVTRKVDHQFYINFDFYQKDNYDYHRKDLYGFNQVPRDRRIGTFQLNHISLKLPHYSLLSQYQMIEPGSLCNSTNIPSSCKKEHCACTHVMNVKLNSVVELIFVDEGKFAIVNHPLHLHGHFFRVISEVNLKGNVTVDRVKQLDRQGKIIRRLDRAPMKDTIKAPGGGYTVVRFYADNPGYWFFHCHFEQHNNIGMALIFKVGEHRNFPPKPENFPTCGNFVPEPKSKHHNLNNIEFDHLKTQHGNNINKNSKTISQSTNKNFSWLNFNNKLLGKLKNIQI